MGNSRILEFFLCVKSIQKITKKLFSNDAHPWLRKWQGCELAQGDKFHVIFILMVDTETQQNKVK